MRTFFSSQEAGRRCCCHYLPPTCSFRPRPRRTAGSAPGTL